MNSKPLAPGSYTISAKDIVLDKNGQVRLAPNAKPIPTAPYKIHLSVTHNPQQEPAR